MRGRFITMGLSILSGLVLTALEGCSGDASEDESASDDLEPFPCRLTQDDNDTNSYVCTLQSAGIPTVRIGGTDIPVQTVKPIDWYIQEICGPGNVSYIYPSPEGETVTTTESGIVGLDSSCPGDRNTASFVNGCRLLIQCSSGDLGYLDPESGVSDFYDNSNPYNMTQEDEERIQDWINRETGEEVYFGAPEIRIGDSTVLFSFSGSTQAGLLSYDFRTGGTELYWQQEFPVSDLGFPALTRVIGDQLLLSLSEGRESPIVGNENSIGFFMRHRFIGFFDLTNRNVNFLVALPDSPTLYPDDLTFEGMSWTDTSYDGFINVEYSAPAFLGDSLWTLQRPYLFRAAPDHEQPRGKTAGLFMIPLRKNLWKGLIR